MADTDAKGEAQAKKPNIFKRLWDKSGLLPIHVILAFKGALPPTIALAAYEAYPWANLYTTLGYLAAIMSHLSLAIQPRAKFIQSILISTLFSCTGAAFALLQIQCMIAARATPTGRTAIGASGAQETMTYDSNASTVGAVWLAVWVFVANYARAARPQLMLPVIQFTIFVVVASVYGPSFPTMAVGEAFVRKLLMTFLTGFGIATGVSLFVIPMTSRASAEKQMGGVLNLLKACISTHSNYMQAISNGEENSAEEKQHAAKLQGLMIKTGGLFGKIKLELSFARKEIAYGYLRPEHYSEIYQKLRQILQPVMGLSTFLEMVRALRENHPTSVALPQTQAGLDAVRTLQKEEWADLITISKSAHGKFRANLFAGFDHINIQLGFAPRPKKSGKSGDVEENASETPKPGDAGFTDYLEIQLNEYQDQRNHVIQDWASKKGLSLPKTYWETHAGKPPLERGKTSDARVKLNQHQLYLILYIRFLTYNIGRAVLELARFADARHEDGTMTKKRIIRPGWKRLRKLFWDAFNKCDSDETLSNGVNGGTNIFLGDGLKHNKDPEHLPPTNFYQRFTDGLRTIPHALSSEHASFALRATVATMSLGIIGYLSSTRNFFLQQRGLWSLIMTAISMDPHAGQGLFGFGARIFGTTVAMVCSIGIWYMCDKKHPAVLVIFYIYMAMWVMFLVRVPQYAVVAMISSITVILIIGYELQVDVIGIKISTSNGQTYYPVYELAPYRLLSVIIGITVAFIWTFFPYPITTYGTLRKDIGSTLYILANYYSTIHTTMDARVRFGPSIKDLPPGSPMAKLDTVRRKVFGKSLLMLTRLREYHNFTKFEPTFGGRFPSETYSELITSLRNVFSYLALITYSSETFTRSTKNLSEKEMAEEAAWLDEFRKMVSEAQVTSHEITTSLCLLSASMRTGSPLPPYLRTPLNFKTTQMMDDFSSDVLSVEHFSHPCYAAFAVIGVASTFCTAELARTNRLVKELVGEVDFSFHVVSTNDDSSSTTSTLWDKWVKEDNGSNNGNGSSGSEDKRKGD